MWKKIILALLIAIPVLICLWIMSLDSIVDKDGMIYEENNKNVINQNIELQEHTPTQSYKNLLPQWSTCGTIIDEGLDIFISKLQEKAESNEYLNKLKQQDNYEEIKEALAPNDYNMIVTPKEIDDLIENMKDVIARGINYPVKN